MKLELLIKTFIGTAIMSAASPTAAQEDSNGHLAQANPAARIAVFGANVGINGLICGTIAAIDQRSVLKDAAKCMFGGGVQYLGMELGMHDVPVLPGASLRIVETGTSIIDNTLAGRGALDRLHYELGPALFEIDLQDEFNHLNWYWRILPIGGLAANIAKGNSLNAADTFSYQTFSFNTDVINGAEGFTLGNIMAYSPKESFIRAHEFNHVLQYVRFRPIDQLFPNFLREKAHWRIGEDLLIGTMNLPLVACLSANGEHCGRYWWELTEIESYIMETADESFVNEF